MQYKSAIVKHTEKIGLFNSMLAWFKKIYLFATRTEILRCVPRLFSIAYGSNHSVSNDAHNKVIYTPTDIHQQTHYRYIQTDYAKRTNKTTFIL